MPAGPLQGIAATLETKKGMAADAKFLSVIDTFTPEYRI
jgi:hypothetical protein